MAFFDSVALATRVSNSILNRPNPHTGGALHVASDAVAASANIGDVFRFVRLPVGSIIFDAWLWIDSAAGASVTANFGWLSVGGAVDSPSFFGSALDLNAGLFYRSIQSTGIIKVNDDIYIAAVIAGANFGAIKSLRATVFHTPPA